MKMLNESGLVLGVGVVLLSVALYLTVLKLEDVRVRLDNIEGYMEE